MLMRVGLGHFKANSFSFCLIVRNIRIRLEYRTDTGKQDSAESSLMSTWCFTPLVLFYSVTEKGGWSLGHDPYQTHAHEPANQRLINKVGTFHDLSTVKALLR